MARINTTTSVLALKFDGGVIVAADTLASYGSMARYYNCDRIKVVNDSTVVSASGDFADFQYLSQIIENKQISEEEWSDGQQLSPHALHSWITRVAYSKRSKMEPLWCSWVVAGMQLNPETGVKEPFLGFCDYLGLSYKENLIATGFGQHLAMPLFRDVAERLNQSLPSEEEARTLVASCMEILYYRDARSWPKYKQVTVKADGVRVEENIEFRGNWELAKHVVPIIN